MSASLQILIVGSAVGLASGYGWYARFRDHNRSLLAKSLSFVLPPAIFALLMILWMVMAEAPFDRVSPLTLAASASLWAKGSTELRESLRVGGPLLPLAFAPAAILGAPTRALLFGGFLSLVWFLVPAFLVCRIGGKRSGAQIHFAIGAFIAFALLCLHSEILRFAAIRCGPAAPSAGLLALAICRIGDGEESDEKALRAAILTAAAILIQPSFFPVMMFFGGWVASTRGLPAAIRFLRTFVVALLVGAIFCGMFHRLGSVAQMLFLDPWTAPWNEGSQLMLIGMAILEVALGYGPLFIALGVYGAFRRSVPALRRWKPTQSMWPLALAAAAGVFPGAMLDRVQVGGDAASWSPVLFFLFLSFCLAAAEELGRVRTSARPLAAVVAVASFMVLVGIHVKRIERFHSRPLASNEEELAYRFAKMHPKEMYYPQHPLATALADRVGLPLADRQPVGEQKLPASIVQVGWTVDEYVEASSPTASAASDSKLLLLSAFPVRTTDEHLPGWILHERAPDPVQVVKAVEPPPVTAKFMEPPPVLAPPPKKVVRTKPVMPPLNRKKRKSPARLPPL